jgi:hypothetical protein
MLRFRSLVLVGGSALLLAAACGGDSDPSGAGATGGVGASGGGGQGGADWLASCALAAACMSDAPMGLGTVCTSMAQAGAATGDPSTDGRLEAATVACLLAAVDCDAVRACVKASGAEAAVCPGTDNIDRCSGTTLVECTDQPGETPDAFDCAAAGLVCGQGATNAACGTEICDPAGGEQTSCQGDSVVHCDTGTGVVVISDCRYTTTLSCGTQGCTTAMGGTCGTMDVGGIGCVGTGADCDPSTFTTQCNGSVLVSCRHGKQSDVDCATLVPGYTCADLGDGLFNCMAGAACVPGQGESCQGNVAQFCLNGELAEIDCVAAGYSSCQSGGSGTDTIAWCVP